MADRTNKQAEVTPFGPGNKQITSTTSGSKELLDVNANIANNESPTKYQLKSAYSVADTALNTSTDTTLATYTGDGVFDFLAITGSNANFEVVITVDGTERLRISMADLGSELGLVSGAGPPMWTSTANKQFRYHPTPEVGFATSVTISAKATGTPTPTVNYLFLYRERID